MNKKLLILMALILVVIPVASACGRTTTTGGMLAEPVPHAIDVRFENCMACHVADQLAAKPIDHVAMGFTNENCTQKGCHAAPGATTTTPPPSTTKTTTSTPPASTTDTSTPPASTTETSTPPSSTPSGGTPPDISSHAVAAMAGTCTMCHVVGMNKTPESHAAYTNDMCLTCHKAAAGNS